MIEILRSFIDTICLVANFLWHTITSLITFITHIPIYLSFIVQSVAVLPSVLIPFCIVSVYVYVMYFILARE